MIWFVRVKTVRTKVVVSSMILVTNTKIGQNNIVNLSHSKDGSETKKHGFLKNLKQ